MTSDIAAAAEAESVLKGAFGRTNPLVTSTSSAFRTRRPSAGKRLSKSVSRLLRKKNRSSKTSASPDEARKLVLLNSVRTTQAAQLKVLQRTMGPKRRRAHERSMRCNTKACYAVSHYTGWPRIKRSPWSTQVLLILRFVAFYVAFVLVNVFALNGVVSSEALQLHAYVKNIMLGTEFDQAMNIEQTVFDMGPNAKVTPWTLPVSIKPRSTFLDLDSKENAYQWMRATIRDNLVTDNGFGSFDGRNIVSFLSFRQLRVTEDHQQYSPSNEAKEWTYCDSLLGSPGDAAYAASNGPGGGPPPGGRHEWKYDGYYGYDDGRQRHSWCHEWHGRHYYDRFRHERKYDGYYGYDDGRQRHSWCHEWHGRHYYDRFRHEWKYDGYYGYDDGRQRHSWCHEWHGRHYYDRFRHQWHGRQRHTWDLQWHGRQRHDRPRLWHHIGWSGWWSPSASPATAGHYSKRRVSREQIFHARSLRAQSLYA